MRRLLLAIWLALSVGLAAADQVITIPYHPAPGGGGSGPAVVTGTAATIAFNTDQNPAGQSVTVPADATGVALFWTYYPSGGAAGHGIASVTLAGNAATGGCEVASDTGDQSAAGVSYWLSPGTGSMTLDPAWDAAPAEGPTAIVAFFKGNDTIRDCDADNNTTNGAAGVTLTTASGDLVLCTDQHFHAGGTPPSAQGGSWVSVQTQANNSEAARASSISATGATQAFNSVDLNYSTAVCISVISLP